VRVASVGCEQRPKDAELICKGDMRYLVYFSNVLPEDSQLSIQL